MCVYISFYVHTLRESFYQLYCIDAIWENIIKLPLIIALTLGIEVEVSDVFGRLC